MFDITQIPTVAKAFKEYALQVSGNANFLTVTTPEQPKAKLYAINASLPFNEIADLVCKLFPLAVITNCMAVSPRQLWPTKNPIVVGAVLLANTHYFVFPLIHNLRGKNGNTYSLTAPYTRMRQNVLRQFKVCAVVEFGKVRFSDFPDSIYGVIRPTKGSITYDAVMADIDKEVLENEGSLLRQAG